MTAKKSGDKPEVAFTLEQIEEEVKTDLEPLRMSVRGKVIELESPMGMDVGAFESMMSVMTVDQDSMIGELGEAGMVMRMLPAMIGDENYQVLKDAKTSLPALMRIFSRVNDYYAGEMEKAAADPKDSTSQ